MKIPLKIKGFTLIELISVISIIMILMGLLLPTLMGVKETTKKAQAKNDVINIVTSVKSFYTEYGSYPAVGGTSGVLYTGTNAGTSNATLLANLTGTSTVTGTLNPRQIAFIEIPTAKTPASPKAGLSGGVWYDPWGIAYNVAVDTGYNNQIPKATHLYQDPVFLTINTGVIAFSFGKDKQQGTNGNLTYANSDDVISWQ